MKKVESGHFVKVHYTGKFDSGEVFDSSEGCQPLEVQVGSGQVIPAFEDALVGMAVNEKKTFRIEPKEAYGDRDEGLHQTLSRADLPPNYEPQVGEFLALRTPDDQRVYATVAKVTDQDIVIDFNHVLAGKALNFDVEVVEINDQASPQQGCGCGCSCS